MRQLFVNAFARRILITVTAVALTGIYVASQPTSSVEELTRQAQEAWSDKQSKKASELLSAALLKAPNYNPALLLSAEIAVTENRSKEALEYLRRLRPEDDEATIEGLIRAGNLSLSLGRASDAEYFFKQVLTQRPHNRLAHQRLAALLVAEGRRWESAPHLWEMIRLRRFSLEDLALVGNLDELFDGTEMLKFFERSDPDDPAPLTGLARLALHKNETETAEKLLKRIVSHAPDQIEAQVNLGKLLSDAGRAHEFLQWHSKLPVAAEEHPSTWAVRASFAQSQGQDHGAIRCYWETIRRDPNHQRAHYQLSHLLVSEGQADAAQRFAERAKDLEALSAITYDVLMEGANLTNFQQAAELTERLGRLWEAWAWNLAITVHFPQASAVAQTEATRLEEQLHADVPRTLPALNLANQINLSQYPLPDWASRSSPGLPKTSPSSESPAFRFASLSQSSGLDVTYRNGASGAGMQIYQSVGGGVAVFDYDNDGWPDLVFPQAGNWPVDPSDPSYHDQFFRNIEGRAFEEVSDSVAVPDSGYGLGVSTGDFNCDGLADVYILNIGRNRLLVNNGDGTFSDVTDAAGLDLEQWTSSGLIADLNGDGLPDLFDVNYCGGTAPFERLCDNTDAGEARTCKPTLFEADPDSVLLNEGDGTFRNVTAEAGVVENDGRGLGIVAFDPEGDGRLNVFVANDMTANFYWVNETPSPGGLLQLREQGVLSGLAFDFDGGTQACMGIAADDADGDGRLDLFVTNYYNESNTLYIQRTPEVFTDATRSSGLRDGSMSMLGFGTQFIDVELDGWPDLVVANGHVDDFSQTGMPFRMRPQVFRNHRGRFSEVPASQLGPYFQGERLGRGLARLDWNGDGREDFVVTHLFEPAKIVENETTPLGNSLRLRLVGTESSRDAIGATVSVKAGGNQWTKQLTAGDGFQSKNQQQLIFGIPLVERSATIEVRWPSGQRQRFEGVPPDTEYMMIEGRDRLSPAQRSSTRVARSIASSHNGTSLSSHTRVIK